MNDPKKPINLDFSTTDITLQKTKDAWKAAAKSGFPNRPIVMENKKKPKSRVYSEYTKLFNLRITDEMCKTFGNLVYQRKRDDRALTSGQLFGEMLTCYQDNCHEKRMNDTKMPINVA